MSDDVRRGREAACSCGAVRATCVGEPVRVSVCHCLACQRRTGSAFGAQARFPSDAVTIVGTTSRYVRTADSGNAVTFRFCPACGATIAWELAALPGFVAVPIGAFADETFPPPRISIYEARAHAWASVAGDVEHLD